MRIAIGADHAGFELKGIVAKWVSDLGHEVIDLGAHTYDALDDYPDFAALVAKSVAAHEVDRGIVVCGSGVGACIAANKVKGSRAMIAMETYTARQGVEHDDANVLVLGGRVMGIEPAHEVVKAFLSAEFSNEERHVRRLNKVLTLEG